MTIPWLSRRVFFHARNSQSRTTNYTLLPPWRRTDYCGALRGCDAGREVALLGWVTSRRDHGGLIFIDLRDRDGIVQIVFNPEHNAAAHEVAGRARSEFYLAARASWCGAPRARSTPSSPTGEIEVAVTEARGARTLGDAAVRRSPTTPTAEDVRLKYRYLDLRRPAMQRNLRRRHRRARRCATTSTSTSFIEVETPILIKSTPEGARDYLVPSRVHPGTFYALPQSPQILKQLLMVGGIGRYMQIARCFRDEDPRADRQPEFTQIDVEMSFVARRRRDRDDGRLHPRRLVARARATIGEIPRSVAHAEAMRRFGSDKPDLRFGLKLVDVAELFRGSDFRSSATLAATEGNRVIALRVPRCARRDLRRADRNGEIVRREGLAYITLAARRREGPDRASSSAIEIGARCAPTSARERRRDPVRRRTRRRSVGHRGPAAARDRRRLGLRDPAASRSAGCAASRCSSAIRTPARSRSRTIRSPRRAGPRSALRHRSAGHDARSTTIWCSTATSSAADRSVTTTRAPAQDLRAARLSARRGIAFGFFLEALRYGAPPHGGMALGIDRIAMLACGTTHIRDVMAFPKNQMARDPMSGAPSEIDLCHLRDFQSRWYRDNSLAGRVCAGARAGADRARMQQQQSLAQPDVVRHGRIAAGGWKGSVARAAFRARHSHHQGASRRRDADHRPSQTPPASRSRTARPNRSPPTPGAA